MASSMIAADCARMAACYKAIEEALFDVNHPTYDELFALAMRKGRGNLYPSALKDALTEIFETSELR